MTMIRFTILSIAALSTASGAAEKPFAEASWTPIFLGVEHASVEAAVPRPLKAQVLRVNLGTPGVSVVATPDNGDAPGETSSLRTSGFLKLLKCQAAVNAAPFDKVSSREGLPMDISGLQVSMGKTVSPDNGNPALFFLGNSRAAIGRKPFPMQEIKEAVSGFQIILQEGKTVATDLNLHPRTGAGISRDGNTLWLLVVDGRQQGVSEGCTTVEMAEWFRSMGAFSGINLDGGGTTTMVMEGADGQPKVMNRPIHAGIPGLERPAGSHLGIKAIPLK